MGNKKGKKKGNKKKGNKKKGGGGKRREQQQPLHAIGRAPTYTQSLSAVDDFLDETEMKSFEKFGCISFASPGDTMREQFKVQISTEHNIDEDVVDQVVEAFIELEHPKRAVKYLGGRATPQECASRIKEVMDEENSFHIYTIENGKWVTFDPSPDLIENENYREEQLNEIMREKKMGEKRTKQFYRSEMRKRVEKARLEGTEEGQQILLEAEEPFEAVKNRVDAAGKSIAEFEEKIAELKRVRELAERKVEKMIVEGKDKVDVAAVTDQRMEQLAAERSASASSTVKDQRGSEIRDQLRELGDIESARVWPENLGQETASALQPSSGESDPPTTEEEQDAAVLKGLEQRITQLQELKEQAELKIEEKKAATVPTGPASDAETAAMFDDAGDEILIPALRRQAEEKSE